MMNFRRIIQLTSSLAAALTLTACGGGGDTGPQWVQNLKESIVYGQLQLPVGTFYGSCDPIFPSNVPQARMFVKVIEKSGGAYYLTNKVEYYDDLSCSQGTLAVTSTSPKARLTYVDSGDDAVSGLPYQKYLTVYQGGPVDFMVADGSDATVEDDTSEGVPAKKITFSNGFEVFDTKISFAVNETIKEIVGNNDLSLFFGKAGTSTPTSDGYPTELDTVTQNRPYRLFSITPGTYASACFEYTDELTASTFSAIQKIIAAPLDGDYRPELTVVLDFFQDGECNDRLVTFTFPSSRVETLGNGIDATTTPLTYQQVAQLQSAGTAVPTIDPAPGNAGRVTVNGNLVSISDGRSIPLLSLDESVSYDSFFFSINTLYQGDRASINSAVSPFPTRLLVEEPFFRQVD